MEWNVPPKGGEFAAEEIADAQHHFLGGFVGECQEQNALRGNALFEQERGAIGQRARFARAGARDHQRRAGRGRHRRALLVVQIPLVVDMEFQRGTERFYDVIARHGGQRNLSWQSHVQDQAGFASVASWRRNRAILASIRSM